MHISRTLNIVEIRFQRDSAEGGLPDRLDAQCAFRAVREEQILLGSYDMSYPKDRNSSSSVAYDSYATIFDSNAALLTDLFESREFHVIDAKLGQAGEVTLSLTDSVRLEVLPACSGPQVESWRAFEKGGEHFVYPEEQDA
jgi:hypothetical protein